MAKCEAEFPGSLVGVGSSNICGWSRNVCGALCSSRGGDTACAGRAGLLIWGSPADMCKLVVKTDGKLVIEKPAEMKSLRIATLNVLTLSLAEARESNGLRIPVRQARHANTFEDAGSVVIGLQEYRLPSQLVVRDGFVMVTSETEDGRDDCGLWLSTRRVGREHLAIVHSTSWRFVPRRVG